MQPELRHLRAFLAVAEQGSANRASLALFRAQSAISRSIGKLERELDVKLFERRSRGMLLTEYGRALLVRAQRVQAEMKLARAEIAAVNDKAKDRNAAIFNMLTHERRVRAFVALTEQHHMPSVAESIGITQPAVSMAIRQLEESVGTPLFERTARGMIPTPAGAALAFRLKRAMAEIRHAAADIAGLRGVNQGVVTVGALPLGRTRLLPESIAGLVRQYPGLRVTTVEGSFETLAASLARRRTRLHPRRAPARRVRAAICTANRSPTTSLRSSPGTVIHGSDADASRPATSGVRSGCCRVRTRPTARCSSAR